MRVVTRRTGLTAELLRAWERRHEVVRPARSAGGRRLYSDADIERLRLLYRATLAGRGISQVAALSTDALAELVRRDAAADAEAVRVHEDTSRTDDASLAAAAHYAECLHALEQLDAPMAAAALWRAAIDLSAISFFDAVVLPLLEGAGMRPSAGTLRPLHRHLAIIAVRRVLHAMIERAGQSAAMPALVVAAPAGIVDESGALVVGALAAIDGWRVTYLGADVLAEDTVEAATRTRARGVVLNLAPQTDPAVLSEIRRLRRALPSDVALVVGGAASGTHRVGLDEIGALHFDDLAGYRVRLSTLRRARRRSRGPLGAPVAHPSFPSTQSKRGDTPPRSVR